MLSSRTCERRKVALASRTVSVGAIVASLILLAVVLEYSSTVRVLQIRGDATIVLTRFESTLISDHCHHHASQPSS